MNERLRAALRFRLIRDLHDLFDDGDGARSRVDDQTISRRYFLNGNFIDTWDSR
jgi:hypothetical protein